VKFLEVMNNMSRITDHQPSLQSGPEAGHDDNAHPFRHAQTELDVLGAIIRMLPVGLTVQDERGNFLLVNDTAALHLDTPAVALDSTTLDAFATTIGGQDSATPAQARAPAILSQQRVMRGQGERVLLTVDRPVSISERTLTLSALIDFTKHKAVEDELERRANFDELTGLPKRTLVEAYVNELLANRDTCGRFAMVFLDIDNFKHINDYYGHATGDALLEKFAKRVRSGLHDTDMLARISGDEFLIVLNPIGDDISVSTTVERLLQRLKAPLMIDGFEIFASASIGVSLFPDHGQTYATLRHNADIAMYRVKSEIKGGFAIFDSHMEQEATARTELEQALRLAILEKRFRCAFQPKVDIRSREVIGVEALVRLYNDDGLIQVPGSFIDLAVELGLIDELTHLVLNDVMASLDLIDERFGAGISISLNVAAKQAGDHPFMRSFTQALAATGCPSRFMVEVTEDAFIRKNLFQTEVLPSLRALGVRVSIDDFGTGYSSLSALAEITADEIKIDRSFITDIHLRPRNQAVLRAIESLSEALGMTMIAEGVESHEELAYLQAATRIRYAQGYYFSKPVFVDDLNGSDTASGGRGLSSGRQQHEDRHSQLRSRSIGR
jgi:c-di-GMP phosphodiesterase Gmr